MARVVVGCGHGSESPDSVVVAYLTAGAALDRGDAVVIWLTPEGVRPGPSGRSPANARQGSRSREHRRLDAREPDDPGLPPQRRRAPRAVARPPIPHRTVPRAGRDGPGARVRADDRAAGADWCSRRL